MPATYKKVSSLVPSSQRTTVIEDVETGDHIDLYDVLGRPAKRIKIIPSSDSETIEIRLNNKINIPSYYSTSTQGEGQRAPIDTEIVSAGAQYPVYALTGSTQYYTEEGVTVSFIDIVSNSGDPLTIYVW